MKPFLLVIALLWNKIGTLGCVPQMDEHEKGKLSVFNKVNLVGTICGLITPLVGAFDQQELPLLATLVALSPTLISATVLWLNYKEKQEAAKICYFTFYPIITSLVYSTGLDVGLELFFLLYGILAIFYLKKLSHGFAAFALSMLLYFLTFVLFDQYAYKLREASFPFYILNHAVAVTFIFLSLSWIKKENINYQRNLLDKNEILLQTNVLIQQQKQELVIKADQLSALNNVKNKLFSVISHDLKNPIYALRNLFKNIEQYDLPGEEIKVLLPDIVRDLNYTTTLMENLLQWAKSQMDATTLRFESVDLAAVVKEATQLLRLQAENKRIYLESKVDNPVYVYADKDVLNLVLRNLLSNAVKFTPEHGNIRIEAIELNTGIEILVSDSGTGMSSDVLQKLSGSNFYTSRGTANEGGTGLGLMLCKEFLGKIGSKMYIESEEGKGSTFSFMLNKGSDATT